MRKIRTSLLVLVAVGSISPALAYTPAQCIEYGITDPLCGAPMPNPQNTGDQFQRWFVENGYAPDENGNWIGSGANGADGASAYDIWLNEGNTGTVSDFIDWMQGDQGDKGDKGDKGDRGEQGLQGIQGERGEQGIQGEKGDKGDDYVMTDEDWQRLAEHDHDVLEKLESLLMGEDYDENGHDHATNPDHEGLASNVQDKFDKADGAFQRDNITNVNDDDFDIFAWADRVLNGNGGGTNDPNNPSRAATDNGGMVAPESRADDAPDVTTVYDTQTIDAMFSLTAAALADPVADLNKRVDSMQTFVNDMNKELSAGIASATALTGIDNHLDKSSRYSVGISGGHFNGQSSVAAGAVIRTNYSSALNFGIAFDTYQSKPAVRVGWNMQW